ncbi:RNA-directed DNA polymerase, eukaryota [Tanacetum coccineum]
MRVSDSLFNKNKDKSKNIKPSDHSLKHPPGFTPNGDNNEFCMHEENVQSVNEVNSLNHNVEEDLNGQERNSINKGSKEEVSGSVCSGNFKKSEVPRTGGSILCVLEELVKVGQAMGYNMDGDPMYMEPNTLLKNMLLVSDYFIMVRGVWLKTGVNIIMVAVYAPQELRDKRILWDYLEHVINQWDGEVVIMGDFNEVRFKSERFGLVFNAQGADVFNAFIVSTGLEEVPLGGKFKEELQKLDADIDKGIGSDDIVNKRLEVLNSIQHLDKIQAMDVAQKAKIKWDHRGD